MGVLCKFAAYFRNTFAQEHQWRAASAFFFHAGFNQRLWLGELYANFS